MLKGGVGSRMGFLAHEAGGYFFSASKLEEKSLVNLERRSGLLKVMRIQAHILASDKLLSMLLHEEKPTLNPEVALTRALLLCSLSLFCAGSFSSFSSRALRCLESVLANLEVDEIPLSPRKPSAWPSSRSIFGYQFRNFLSMSFLEGVDRGLGGICHAGLLDTFGLMRPRKEIVKTTETPPRR